MDIGNSSQILENTVEVLWSDSLDSRKDRLVMLAVGQETAMIYWEWTKSRADFFRKGAFSPEITITVFDSQTRAAIAQFKRGWNELHFYFNPPRTPGLYYFAELTIASASNEPHSKLDSNVIFMPRGGLAAPHSGQAALS